MATKPGIKKVKIERKGSTDRNGRKTKAHTATVTRRVVDLHAGAGKGGSGGKGNGGNVTPFETAGSPEPVSTVTVREVSWDSDTSPGANGPEYTTRVKLNYASRTVAAREQWHPDGRYWSPEEEDFDGDSDSVEFEVPPLPAARLNALMAELRDEVESKADEFDAAHRGGESVEWIYEYGADAGIRHVAESYQSESESYVEDEMSRADDEEDDD